MTIAEHAQLNGILITGFGLIITALVGYVVIQFKYLSALTQTKIDALEKVQNAKQDALTARVDINHAAIEHLANGGGDAKMDNRLRVLGIIPTLAHGLPMNRRRTDRTPYAPNPAETAPSTAPAAPSALAAANDAPAPAAALAAPITAVTDTAGVLSNND